MRQGLGRHNHEDCVRAICEQDHGPEQPTPVENGEISKKPATPPTIARCVYPGHGGGEIIPKEHASTARNLLGLVRDRGARRHEVNDTMSLSQRADALEAKMARELDYIVILSLIHI